MSNTDTIIYQNALSSYFPENIVSKSEDLIPCKEFYQEIESVLSGPEIWGPPIWIVLHYSTFVTDQQLEFNINKEYLAALSGIFDLLLPCISCRYHYRSTIHNEDELLPRPFPLSLPLLALEYAKKQNLFEFYSLLHNHCKPILDKKEPLSVEHYKRFYKSFYETGQNKVNFDR